MRRGFVIVPLLVALLAAGCGGGDDTEAAFEADLAEMEARALATEMGDALAAGLDEALGELDVMLGDLVGGNGDGAASADPLAALSSFRTVTTEVVTDAAGTELVRRRYVGVYGGPGELSCMTIERVGGEERLVAEVVILGDDAWVWDPEALAFAAASSPPEIPTSCGITPGAWPAGTELASLTAAPAGDAFRLSGELDGRGAVEVAIDAAGWITRVESTVEPAAGEAGPDQPDGAAVVHSVLEIVDTGGATVTAPPSFGGSLALEVGQSATSVES